VRERVERLGGDIAVESEPGKGTTFRVIVPLTLATYRGIVVRVGEHAFILPTSAVERVMAHDRVAPAGEEEYASLKTDEGPVPVIALRDILELPASADEAERSKGLLVMLAGADRRRVAVEIDVLVGEQEILVKPIGKSLQRVRNVQGATILATGEIAPILNVSDLLKSAVRVLRAPRAAAPQRHTDKLAHKNILLAEDSITARSLLKSILESAGYRVKTAVDGMEAWALLKIEPFDLLVSDVEMPRMNGFDLTARIRADGKLSDLPVVLVTALESSADLERGVDVGANAYIRKGGFEQSQLLDAVRRFA
jgi:two-component system chemotaxis sensor kinase CheA